jgi:lactobin A/cerein 7B family class IIb bacteriocin
VENRGKISSWPIITFLKMKTLDLEQMGVQEMDAKEMMEISGGLGWLPAFLIGAIAGGAVYDAWKAGAKATLAGETGYRVGEWGPR